MASLQPMQNLATVRNCAGFLSALLTGPIALSLACTSCMLHIFCVSSNSANDIPLVFPTAHYTDLVQENEAEDKPSEHESCAV